ncbi:MAG: DNA polymerase I [Bacteroidetes bacterium]|nr:DNA polymerase I [Bacteroidota bacterium]MBX7237849.1 DNA polymerase I [Bacteroidia bacterium]MCC7513728.1 DNA polymerase I [Bacteroidia bacterium]MCW5918241.1 DNA polymerase I [Bacteroidota bacterium]HMW10361.1 DNA polymerase I [Bacteroidia bacterium]
MNEDKRLFLLDAYALIYRAYFAFSKTPLVNSKGQNVSAVSGFTSTLFDLMRREKPTHIAVVFDAAAETTRAAEHSFYKANRQEMPEDIQTAVPYIKEIIKAFHIPILEYDGYEADDIIGTVAKQKEEEGYTVFMVTPDKDYAQLVSPNVFIYKPGRLGNDIEILGVKEIQEKWEVENPKQVIDILGMWGDAVDNIPGIPGVGEKTAKKLIKEYGSMENVIANAENIKGKLGENIRNNVEQARISKQLATIILDVPVEVNDDDLLMSLPDKEKLSQLFTELEFRSLGKRILGEDFSVNRDLKSATSTSVQTSLFEDESIGSESVVVKGKNIQNTAHTYTLVEHDEAIDDLVKELLNQNEICFDTETSSLDYFSLNIVGLSFSFNSGTGYYIPCPEDFEKAKSICHKFKPVLEHASILKIGQNIKFDMLVLKRYGVEVKAPLYDTMIAHYLVEPDMKHGMDYLSETYLGYTPVHIEELIGKKGKNQGSMRDVPIDKIKEYAAEDADITFQLKQVLSPMVEKHEVEGVLKDIELPLIPVLADMEYEGVKIDVDYLNVYSKELEQDMLKYRSAIFDIAGLEFNLDSPRQLGDVLFGHLKLPVDKKTATGQHSTNEEVLSKLAQDYPIAEKILEYRELTKLKSTYVDALPQMVNVKTGRVHTTFNQTIASTGRLSSIGPNLQNIPIRTERGQRVRKAFIARDNDHILLSADYSQIELRLAAEISGDENMLEAFRQGLDIHQATAARVYNVALGDVTKEMRSKAKMVNFGIIYAISAFGLSQRLGIPRKEAAELIENYFVQYPKLRNYMSETLEFARHNGYVKTLMGRRRYLKDINSRNFTVRGFAEREAINSPLQGSAADLVKLAMIHIHEEFKRQNLKSKMTLQVHDELVFDAHKDEVDLIKPIIREKMIHAIKTRVPLEVEIGIGTNWLDAH